MNPFRGRLTAQTWFLPLLVACIAFTSVIGGLDAAGDYPFVGEGPGITLDEGFNVDHGVRLADRALSLDPTGYCQACDLLPDHPPLGRLWIGIVHELVYLIVPPADRTATYSISCARVSGGLAFAGLIFAVGCVGTRWYGRFAGAMGALALFLMPRLFGHAHVAALETTLNLFYILSVLAVAESWEGDVPPGLRTAGKCGLLFGLALLTKVQALLLPVPIAVWALFTWRKRAIAPLVVWGLSGLSLFFLGWPWLWHAPIQNFLQYLGRTTDRAVIHVWYLGHSVADRDVPWHYPWVMFLVTVPIGLHLLGVWGLLSRQAPVWKSRRDRLLIACAVWPLIVFSTPGVGVYDGERLFLIVFPIWALLVGRGADQALNWLAQAAPRVPGRLCITAFVCIQGVGLFNAAPAYLSYYNLLAGGSRGAERLGFEPTYWGDSLTRSLLRQAAAVLPRDSRLQLLPVMHPFQLRELEQQSPVLRAANLRLEPFSLDLPGDGAAMADRPAVDAPDSVPHPPQYVLLFMRKEYLPVALRQLGQEFPAELSDPTIERQVGPYRVRMLVQVRRGGVLLSALLEFR